MQAISILAALATASAFAPAHRTPAVAARKAVVVEANVGLYFSTMYARSVRNPRHLRRRSRGSTRLGARASGASSDATPTKRC